VNKQIRIWSRYYSKNSHTNAVCHRSPISIS